MATLCLAGTVGNTGLLFCDRAASSSGYISQVEKAAKVTTTHTGSGTAGLLGSGSARLIQRLTDRDDHEENCLQNLSSVTEEIARQGEHLTWNVVRHFESLWKDLPAETRDEILDKWEDQREEVVHEYEDWLRERVRRMAGSRFLFTEVKDDTTEIYQIGCFGTFARKLKKPAAAIGSGKVAFDDWSSSFGLPDSESVVEMSIDLLCIYSIGLDTTNVSGPPVFRILRPDGTSRVSTSDSTVLINLVGCYLSGHLSKGSLEKALRSLIEGQPRTQNEGWVDEKAGQLGVPPSLLRADGMGRDYWLRYLGKPEKSGMKVGLQNIFASDLLSREKRKYTGPDTQSLVSEMAAADSELDNPLPDWEVEEPDIRYPSPRFRQESEEYLNYFENYITNTILSGGSFSMLFSRVLPPLLKRIESFRSSLNSKSEKKLAHIFLYLRCITEVWPQGEPFSSIKFSILKIPIEILRDGKRVLEGKNKSRLREISCFVEESVRKWVTKIKE